MSFMATAPVQRRTLDAQPILLIQRRIPSTQLQSVMGECFGVLFGHGMQAGVPIAGRPIARYIEVGTGQWTIDFAMPLQSPVSAQGEMQAGLLHAGDVAFAIHTGPYELPPETYAVVEQWIEEQGLTAAGPSRESYVTDPSEVPDPAEWKTEVFWPIADRHQAQECAWLLHAKVCAC
jgi:AraC family transcriptional regulator